MSTSEVDSRSLNISMRKSVENLVISSQDAIGQSISQALTFSGVITQHANQIIQEQRNVSRSPSPSLRVADGPDSLDNDKSSETSIAAPSAASGDSASASSGSELPTVVGATPPKADNPKQPAPPSAGRGGEGAARTKKKSWYNALYPTYKSKSDDFKRLFKDLPDDERLIVDYSCALQKDILMHGRLYASPRYLCFYASIFGWETSLSLRWKDVTAITKEKTALVIPNAILVCTEGEKHFLTSFSGRDKAYLMLFRVWQNALLDQPITSQEIWQWVHSCYGEELGFNSDDEGYGRDFPDEAALPADNASEELAESSVEAAGDGREDRGRPDARDLSPPLVSNGDASFREEEVADTLPTDMSDTSDSEPDKPHEGAESEQCTANHEGRLLLQQEFPFNIDQLFTMIFTNSKFNLELLAARGTTDYVQEPWQLKSGRKCRQISYTLGLTSGPIGPKEVQVTEIQEMNACSKPGVAYSIDACSENAGIPYAECFSVHVHYCLRAGTGTAGGTGTGTGSGPARSTLAVRARLQYKKPVWGVVRGFLEKNTMSGLQEFCRQLAARLAAEAAAAPAARCARRQRRRPGAVEVTSSGARPAAAAAPRAPRPAAARALPLLLAALLLLNAALYWLLYQTARDRMGEPGPGGAAGPEQAGAWARLLAQHAARHRHQMTAWSAALDDTRHHLHQTEKALLKLLEIIKPSLDAAQAPDPAPEEPPPPRTDL